jgi:hypothetical protein
MAQQHFLANRGIEMVLLALQAFQVLFLWVHDWIPLGRVNDIAAMAACPPPYITVRLWTPLNESGFLLSLYYQGFRPCTILVSALHAALRRT